MRNFLLKPRFSVVQAYCVYSHQTFIRDQAGICDPHEHSGHQIHQLLIAVAEAKLNNWFVYIVHMARVNPGKLR